jgi:NTP pyrophosphatase (non-canonical NTP hydrolase)
MKISELINDAHESAKEKGFHQGYEQLKISILNSDNIPQRKEDLLNYVIMTEMNKDINLINTELAEASEFIRTKDLLTENEKDNWKESIEEELADTVIRIADFCGKFDIDLEYFIRAKMEYNKNRETMHGKRI